MSKISFSDSIRPKGCFDRIAQNKFESDGFVLSGKKKGKLKKQLSEITPNIEFLSPDIKKSKLHPHHKFTNFLCGTTSESIKTSVFDIFDNPNIIDTPNAGEVRFSDVKIEECLKLYIDPLPTNCLFIKSNLIDVFGVPKPIRVFSMMETISNPEPKAISKIVLIDPFHLVIPSEHDGKTKEVVEQETYNDNKDNQLCMNDYVRDALGF